MIRINLIPHAKRGGAGGAAGVQLWAYVYLAAALAWCLALTFVYFSLASDRDQALAQNAEIKRQIAKVKEQSGSVDELQGQLDRLRQLENVVGELQAARQGPTRMLLELSAILSPGVGPTVDAAKLEEMKRANPEAGFAPGWDPRRLWLLGFSETNRRCTIQGKARNNEDIAEFLRRLSLSQVFDEVVLVRTGEPRSTGRDTEGVAFELKCKVRY